MNEWQERIGVGRPHPGLGRLHGTTRTTRVTADAGPRRGRVVGAQREHWSGRVDAVATPDPIHHTIRGGAA